MGKDLEPESKGQNPGDALKTKASVTSLRLYTGLLVIVWTAVVSIFLAGTLYQERQATLEIARAEARTSVDQIALFRQWNALHKGVYVQIDARTPPNPYLAWMPERDLRTPSGRTLTLVNPAYMIRQLYELAHQQHQVQGRIISLKPLRPENIPDFWETKALKKLQEGAGEYSSTEPMPDQDYLRLIRPLVVEKACLECHASQGYKVGDIRGGISVLVPLAPLLAADREHMSMVWISHGFFWLLGLACIAFASTRLGKSLAQQKRTEIDLKEAKQTMETYIKASPLAIMALDTQGCVRLWNPAAESIFGWRAAEIVGQPPPFLPENPSPEFQELYSRGLQGEPVRGGGECLHRNGMVMEFSFSMSPFYGPQDELTGVMAVLEDITERRQMEEELFKANEKLKVWVYEFSRRNRDITLLNEMGDLLQACHTLEEAYAGVGQYMPLMFPDGSGALFVYHEKKNAVEAAVHWGESPPGATAFSRDECWALRKGREHLVQDPGSGLLCGHLAGIAAASYLCVPIVTHNEDLGLLLLLKKAKESSEEEPLSEAKKRLATTAAKQIALSLANLNLRNSLLQQAIHDPLTGLFNRRYMEETLEREILRVRRKEAPLGIIMLDIDHFKKFNDSCGHEAGDTLLQFLGNFLQANIRQEDIACRYGGEEFILIMPEAPLEVTRLRAEKLRQGVEKLQVEYQGRPLGPVTVSLGVAVFPDHGNNGEALIRAADAALYRGKQGGRNRVMTAGDFGSG
jgi:diguanylate cyclase (GGDEF)-like protein/PAS domain S-box-containing protein